MNKRLNLTMDENICREVGEMAERKGMAKSALVAYYVTKGMEQDKAMDLLSKIPADKLQKLIDEL